MGPNGVKQAKLGQMGQTGPNWAKPGQTESNMAKHVQPRPNGVKPGKLGPIRAKRGYHPWVGGWVSILKFVGDPPRDGR